MNQLEAMSHLETSRHCIGRIESALASMTRAIEQRKANMHRLSYPTVHDLGLIAQQLEEVETFWLEASVLPIREAQ